MKHTTPTQTEESLFLLPSINNDMLHKNGFDQHGCYLLHSTTRCMEPLIHGDSYLCLSPVSDVNEVTGRNGEVYLFVMHGGNTVVQVMGQVDNDVRKDDVVSIRTKYPQKMVVNYDKKAILETYIVLYAITQLPTPLKP